MSENIQDWLDEIEKLWRDGETLAAAQEVVNSDPHMALVAAARWVDKFGFTELVRLHSLVADLDRQAFVMLQINDGEDSVTYHRTEESAYADIVNTAMCDTVGWLGLDEEDKDDAAILDNIKAAIADQSMSRKDVHQQLERYLENSSEFSMKVMPLIIPEAESEG